MKFFFKFVSLLLCFIFFCNFVIIFVWKSFFFFKRRLVIIHVSFTFKIAALKRSPDFLRFFSHDVLSSVCLYFRLELWAVVFHTFCIIIKPKYSNFRLFIDTRSSLSFCILSSTSVLIILASHDIFCIPRYTHISKTSSLLIELFIPYNRMEKV